jgi:hypothetical protein
VSPAGLLPYGEGVFRRRFVIRTPEAGRVVADLEDDFHRFTVVLEHDAERVTRLTGHAARYPWTECPGAEAKLSRLVGLPLSTATTAAAAQSDPRTHCTHLFEVAGLAVAHAAAGRAHRRYDVAIPDRIERRTRATLHRDGGLLLEWEVEGTTLVGPEPFEGREIRGGTFLRWAETTLDADGAEAALVLRRACFISMGRLQKLDDAENAAVYLDVAAGSCHSFTPGVAERARRVHGTSHDFTHAPDGPLADLVAEGASDS